MVAMELVLAAIAGASALASRKGVRRHGEGEGEHEGAAELGICFGGAGEHGKEVGHLARAWPPRIGHASPFGAFPRARGGQRYGRRGKRFWASYRSNWTLGPKAKLKPMNCSTSFIMGAESLEK